MMISVPSAGCQTPSGKSGEPHRRGRKILALLATFGLCLTAAGWAQPPPAPSPTPPPWQRELDAARALETSLLFAASSDPTEAAARRQRLVELYRQIAARYPTQAAPHKSLGLFLAAEGQTTEAIAALRRASELDPADADTADTLGSAYLRLGQVRDAAGQFQRATVLQPDHAAYHFQLANMWALFRHDLFASLDLPDAEALLVRSTAEYRRAAELAPDSLPFARTYAEAFYTLRTPDWETALSAWQRVLALSGTDTDFANSHLARVSLRLRRPADVEKYLALIHDERFAPLATQLRAQAIRLPPPPPTP